MDIRSMRAQIEGIDTLPTIPGILRKLLAVIEKPKISISEIGSFISNDAVLTSRVLKVVNSPIYGFPGKISSLNQALILLGLNVVRGMLLGVSVFEAMQKTMAGLWEHSLGCAVAARIIAKKKGLSEPEEISIAGLLHDIGKVALGLKFPVEYGRAIADARDGGNFMLESEKKHFTISHNDAGAWIAQKWNFPGNLIEPIEYHHNPQLARVVPVQTAIVHFADILTRAAGFGFAGDNFVPAVHPYAWQLLDFSEADLKELVAEVEDSFGEAGEVFLSDE